MDRKLRRLRDLHAQSIRTQYEMDQLVEEILEQHEEEEKKRRKPAPHLTLIVCNPEREDAGSD